NLAYGYAKLDSGVYTGIKMETITSEKHTPILAAMGIRSSVEDMLKWSKALFASSGGQSMTSAANEGWSGVIPLKLIDKIWSPEWDRPIDDGYENNVSICNGWYRGHLPTAGLGYLGLIHRTAGEDPEYNAKYILGQGSKRKLFVGHSGNMNGYSSALFLFPETNSGVVALTNGMNLGDAADFAARIMIQALFNLKPYVDIVSLARREAQLHRKMYDDILVQWLANRDVIRKEADRQEYVGEYQGHNINISVVLREETGHLAMLLNSKPETLRNLEFFNQDAYSFQPTTRDEWLSQGMFDWDDWFVGVLQFQRNKAGKISEIYWEYEPDDGARFDKL
ncbi:hypothetical protein EDB80DRAFT_588635, partial [Ilyonectria destructans]